MRHLSVVVPHRSGRKGRNIARHSVRKYILLVSDVLKQQERHK